MNPRRACRSAPYPSSKPAIAQVAPVCRSQATRLPAEVARRRAWTRPATHVCGNLKAESAATGRAGPAPDIFNVRRRTFQRRQSKPPVPLTWARNPREFRTFQRRTFQRRTFRTLVRASNPRRTFPTFVPVRRSSRVSLDGRTVDGVDDRRTVLDDCRFSSDDSNATPDGSDGSDGCSLAGKFSPLAI
jgi:hypothetical protein